MRPATVRTSPLGMLANKAATASSRAAARRRGGDESHRPGMGESQHAT